MTQEEESEFIGHDRKFEWEWRITGADNHDVIVIIDRSFYVKRDGTHFPAGASFPYEIRVEYRNPADPRRKTLEERAQRLVDLLNAAHKLTWHDAYASQERRKEMDAFRMARQEREVSQ